MMAQESVPYEHASDALNESVRGDGSAAARGRRPRAAAAIVRACCRVPAHERQGHEERLLERVQALLRRRRVAALRELAGRTTLQSARRSVCSPPAAPRLHRCDNHRAECCQGNRAGHPTSSGDSTHPFAIRLLLLAVPARGWRARWPSTRRAPLCCTLGCYSTRSSIRSRRCTPCPTDTSGSRHLRETSSSRRTSVSTSCKPLARPRRSSRQSNAVWRCRPPRQRACACF